MWQEIKMSDSDDEVQDWLQLGAGILKKGEKDYEPDGTRMQLSVLEKSRDAMYTALAQPRKHGKTAMTGVLDPENGVAIVESPRGTFLNTMGVSIKGAFHLSPEETMYLVQRGSLKLHLYGNLLSVEATCAICLSKVDAAEVSTYFYLKKLGYVLVRAPEPAAVHNHPKPATEYIKYLLQIITAPTHTRFAWKRCYTSWRSIYRDLNFINTFAPQVQEAERLTYFVWKPSTKYRKRDPPPPDFYLRVMDARAHKMPTLKETNDMLAGLEINPSTKKSPVSRIKDGCRTLIIAVVDSGMISFVKVIDTQFNSLI